MNRKYEGLIVLDTKGNEASLDELVRAVSKEMEAESATLEEIKKLGRRQFAYNARNIEGAHYVNYYFEAPPEAIEKIQARLRLNESVYLQHYQTLN